MKHLQANEVNKNASFIVSSYFYRRKNAGNGGMDISTGPEQSDLFRNQLSIMSFHS